MFPLLTLQGRDITSIMTTRNPYLYLGYGSILNSTNNNIWVYFNDRYNASKISTTGANNVLIPAALMVSGGTSTSTTMSATLAGGGETIRIISATKQNFYYYFDFTNLTVNLPNRVTLTFGQDPGNIPPPTGGTGGTGGIITGSTGGNYDGPMP